MFKEQSRLMRLFRAIGADKLAWGLRRFHVPVPADGLVLETGSGARPYFRSNVLCDAFLTGQQRAGLELVNDRPLVLGFAEKLPFKDDSFDFVISSYILEHTPDPIAFLEEMQRVGKAGFFEMPVAARERFTNLNIHTLEIHEDKGRIFITKKTGPTHDPDFQRIVNPDIHRLFDDCMVKNPFSFQLRHYWSRETGGIKYEILNPEYEFDWEVPEHEEPVSKPSLIARTKLQILNLNRKLRSLRRKVDIMELLMCIQCQSDKMIRAAESVISCKNCSAEYDILPGGIPNFKAPRSVC